MALPQLFGIVPTGQPLITTPSSAPAQTSFVYALPTQTFSHIVVFLLPGVTLPPDTAAAVYLAYAGPQNPSPNFRFLGGIGAGKESAIFKINGGHADAGTGAGTGTGANVSMSASSGPLSAGAEMILGISVESASSVAAQMATLASRPPVPTINEPSNALVVANGSSQKPQTLVLAQRIIKNAFNFLASFSGNVPVPGSSGVTGVEVVPLKAFEDWWKKFEARVKNDPAFLERDLE
ncbi:MAG: hypothetical protein M1818_006113 [Claussenomyces sp. TS43310]|nr:MAG: hypothetical protein M1818_006113 [Claussenomyces sp. TS43310]